MTAGPIAKQRLVPLHVFVRLALTALAVLICYQFQWMWLRSITCTWNLRLDAVFGVTLHRVSADMVTYGGTLYRYAVACTMVDAFCGTIPLIWDLRRTIGRNLVLVGALAAVLVAFNVCRLSFSDILFARGLSWDWAHNVVSGVCYFILWEWILSRKVLTAKTARD